MSCELKCENMQDIVIMRMHRNYTSHIITRTHLRKGEMFLREPPFDNLEHLVSDFRHSEAANQKQKTMRPLLTTCGVLATVTARSFKVNFVEQKSLICLVHAVRPPVVP